MFTESRRKNIKISGSRKKVWETLLQVSVSQKHNLPGREVKMLK